MITQEEFKKMDLRIAEVVAVSPHPQADKLLVLRVKVDDGQKQLVAGVKAFYNSDSLLGKQIVIINNLEPATIRGVESQGMLLASQDSNGISLLTPDRIVEVGSPVKFKGRSI